MDRVHAAAPRVDLSWARIEPRRGEYDEAELDAVVDAVRAARGAGAEPVVVLHAGALPDWVLARRGWLDPHVLADWSCYVDRVAQRAGVHVRRWATFVDPFGEAGWYDDEARVVLRTLLDAHAAAWLHLRRSQGSGGRAPEVGVVVRAVHRLAEGLRGRAERASAEAGGELEWLRVLATGRVSPPFGLWGELPNGTPALDWVGAIWGGAVRFPGGEACALPAAEAAEARALLHARWCVLGKPVQWFGAAP